MDMTRPASHVASTIALAIALFGFGCSQEPPKARYTVDQYLANPAAMDARLKECADSPGDLRDDPDCVNANAAAERQGVGSLRDLPPLGLVPSEKKEPSQQSGLSPRDSPPPQ